MAPAADRIEAKRGGAGRQPIIARLRTTADHGPESATRMYGGMTPVVSIC
jgi:hypothetical protein